VADGRLMVNLANTSVPAWAEQALVADVDCTGREIVIISIADPAVADPALGDPAVADPALGDAAGQVITGWQLAAERAGIGCRPYSYATLQAAQAAVYDYAARVGSRLMIAGTGSECAALRAAALTMGWLDEEIRIGCTDTSQRRVSCPHCGAITLAGVQIDQVLACGTCARNLIVYHHFSRRSGTYLGYQVDAEDGSARLDGAAI
jgi:hypothetical protein